MDSKVYTDRLAVAGRKLGRTLTHMVGDPDGVYAGIKSHYPNPHTRANFINAFWVHVKKLTTLPPATRDRWAAIFAETCAVNSAIYESNTPNDRQASGMVPHAAILATRDALPYGSPQRLLLGMYTYIDPLRNDFHALEVFSAPPNMPPTGNYIVLGTTNQLIVQQYKTAKTYKTLIIPLPRPLVQELGLSLQLSPRRHVFVMKNGQPYTKESSFSAWANHQLKTLLKNEHITLTMLRHIYITEHTQGMTLAERKQTARNMGHSVMMQLGYALSSV